MYLFSTPPGLFDNSFSSYRLHSQDTWRSASALKLSIFWLIPFLITAHWLEIWKRAAQESSIPYIAPTISCYSCSKACLMWRDTISRDVNYPALVRKFRTEISLSLAHMSFVARTSNLGNSTRMITVSLLFLAYKKTRFWNYRINWALLVYQSRIMTAMRELVVEHPWLEVGCTLGEGPCSSCYIPMPFTFDTHRSALWPCNVYATFRRHFTKEGKIITSFCCHPCPHLV